jgi:nitrate/nitrite transporter NarK
MVGAKGVVQLWGTEGVLHSPLVHWVARSCALVHRNDAPCLCIFLLAYVGLLVVVGLKAILVLYLADFLGFSENTATFALHSFIFFAYAMSVVGGYISDSFLGKYRTILYLSLLYCVGTTIVSLTAIPGVMPGDPPQWWGAAIGLLLVGVGTGGIKSCVSSFVGDQFVPGQVGSTLCL